MFRDTIILVLVTSLVLLCSYQVLSIKVIPERAAMVYDDDEYFTNATLNVRRARRGGDYMVNFMFTLLQYVGNNLTIYGDFYEFLNNEYKPSFIHLHYKLCDLILKDELIGVIVRRVGITKCPVAPAIYTLKNFYFNQEIPSLFPYKKGMIQITATHDAKPNGIIGRAEVMFHIESNVPSKRKSTKASVAGV